MAFIDEVLAADHEAPRKQRHTARRLYRWILAEFPEVTVAESTVRNHVRERRRQLGLLRRETFVPQSYGWAQEAQVDWYEAWVDLGDERTRVQVFAMRSMASGRRSIGLTCMRHSRRSSKRMSTLLPTSAASFDCFATTIWRVVAGRRCRALAAGGGDGGQRAPGVQAAADAGRMIREAA